MTDQHPVIELAKILKEMNGVVLKQGTHSTLMDKTLLNEQTIQGIWIAKIAIELGISDDRVEELYKESRLLVEKQNAEIAFKNSEDAE